VAGGGPVRRDRFRTLVGAAFGRVVGRRGGNTAFQPSGRHARPSPAEPRMHHNPTEVRALLAAAQAITNAAAGVSPPSPARCSFSGFCSPPNRPSFWFAWQLTRLLVAGSWRAPPGRSRRTHPHHRAWTVRRRDRPDQVEPNPASHPGSNNGADDQRTRRAVGRTLVRRARWGLAVRHRPSPIPIPHCQRTLPPSSTARQSCRRTSRSLAPAALRRRHPPGR